MRVLKVVIFKRLGVHEESPKESATSTPLPARLICVTKPSVHGGPARRTARIVICGNFQDVHPDEFTAAKAPGYPWLAPSLASHMGCPIECWDVSTAFLYARLFGDRDTDLGGSEVFMRPPKILVEAGVVASGIVWKIKALYGLRTSPTTWQSERDNTIKSLKWNHNKMEYRLLPCPGTPCLWTLVPFRPGDDPCVKTSGSRSSEMGWLKKSSSHTWTISCWLDGSITLVPSLKRCWLSMLWSVQVLFPMRLKGRHDVRAVLRVLTS